MKTSLFLLLFLSVAAFAEGSVRTSYSTDAIELANVLKNCGPQLAELNKRGPANTITSAVHETVEGLDTYTVEFQAGAIPPSFQGYPVGTLKITKSFVMSSNPSHGALDRPSGAMTYTCEIVSSAE